MGDFYKRWAAGAGKVTKVEALRQAQLDLFQGHLDPKAAAAGRGLSAEDTPVPASKTGYAHPFYWAPFVLMGNWQLISSKAKNEPSFLPQIPAFFSSHRIPLFPPETSPSFRMRKLKEAMTTIQSRNRRIAILGYGACALAGSLWGTGFYFGRLALNEMSVEHMVLYRFLFACLGMLPVLLLHRVRFTAPNSGSC